MKSLIPFLVAVGALGVGAMYLVSDFQERLSVADFNQKIGEQRRLFVEQNAVSRALSDAQFKKEKAMLINWHKAAIGRIVSKFPEMKIENSFIENLEQQIEDGKKKKKNVAAIKDRYQWLKKSWDDTLKKGSYSSLLSQYKNGIRYEVVGFSPFTNLKGEKSLKMDLLLWGPVKDQISFTGVDIQFIRNEEIKNAKGRITHKKSLAKVSGGGAPNVLHPAGPNPEPFEWIMDWPPGVMVGYYVGLPLFPRDAEEFDLKLGVQIRSKGGTTVPIEFSWNKVKIKPEWRLGGGQAWQAETTFGSAEELKAAGIK